MILAILGTLVMGVLASGTSGHTSTASSSGGSGIILVMAGGGVMALGIVSTGLVLHRRSIKRRSQTRIKD